ncbi:GNAT family N-acetyltransferase [Candidatus Micrarchaeota archaeon]|nr:GNAT family N-acetyltransferase [Candidatus Micrarchaeota archaeon]
MTEQIRIIQANEGELDKVKQLIFKIFPSSLVNILEGDIVLVAKQDKKTIGFLHISERESAFLIKGIGVDPTCRSKGIASMLLSEAINVIGDFEKPIYLKVKQENSAVQIYIKHGFFLKKQQEETLILIRKQNN